MIGKPLEHARGFLRSLSPSAHLPLKANDKSTSRTYLLKRVQALPPSENLSYVRHLGSELYQA